MTTVSDGVAVIATQLARTDRRALSEAWYSALHLARDQSAASVRRVRAGAPAPPRAPHVHAAGERVPQPPANAALPAHARAAATVRGEIPLERRRPPSADARRIERAVAALGRRRPLPVAQTVEVAGGRVRLIVHADGRATRVVALCSPLLREPVERALARARFMLAAAGIPVGAP